ncbi:MAG: Fic family protein [Thiohalomonadaceae bacterium]
MYIWQHPDWPHFTWQATTLEARLKSLGQLQARLLGKVASLPVEADWDAQMDALIQNAIRTSEIEGEYLNVESVRSSVARRLGLLRAGVPDKSTAQTDGLIGLLIDASVNYQQPLTVQRLCDWQAALFPQGAGLLAEINIGTLRGDDPMQVISGRVDRPTVHFEAPPRAALERELEQFLDWFNHLPMQLNGLLRVGIAHLWLVTLHPFDDGNGRVTRAVTDMALAQAEQQAIRFYSLSAAIMARRREYYRQLEAAQKGNMDITPWLEWFLRVLEQTMEQAIQRLHYVLAKSRFWQRHAQTVLSERQIKVLNRLLDNMGEEFVHGINASKYQALAKVSKPTATRDLADLLEKGCIERLPGGGRSTRYAVALSSVE